MVNQITITDLNLSNSIILSEDSGVYVLESIDFGAVEGKHNFTTFANLVGSRKDSTTLEPRSISLIGWIVAENEVDMEERKKVINKFFNPLSSYRIKYFDWYIDCVPETSIKYAKEYEENNDILCKFTISFLAGYPFFLSNEEKVVSANINQPVKGFPLEIPADTGIPLGIAGARNNFKIDNKSDTSVGINMQIEVSGNAENPKIENKTNGQFLQFESLNLEGGDIINIITYAGEESLTLTRAGVTQEIFNNMTRDSSFVQLSVGVNIMLVTAESNEAGLDYFLRYREEFVEVQK